MATKKSKRSKPAASRKSSSKGAPVPIIKKAVAAVEREAKSLYGKIKRDVKGSLVLSEFERDLAKVIPRPGAKKKSKKKGRYS